MLNNVLKKVFAWMTIGLLITFATGILVASNQNMMTSLAKIYLFLVFAEIILVIALSASLTKMNPTVSKIMFLLYSFVTGLTFAAVFAQFQLSSVVFIFLITAIIFAVLTILGAVTKLDLTKFGTYLIVALLGVIICSVINIFVGNGTFEIIVCSISLLIFLGFTVYDVQKIKNMSGAFDEEKLAIYGALQLYLDFINIFIRLLQFFGNRKD